MAYVSNIQRYSVHDGPGIRTVVFLLGCPLRCKWCQNPENLAARPVLLFDETQCIGCKACVLNCPQGAILPQNGSLLPDSTLCQHCFVCADCCYTGARQPAGRERTVEEVYLELMRDAPFFAHGGGVTLSGGEPMMHPDFCLSLLQKLKAAGLHTAIESCGYAPWEVVEKLSKYLDLFLFDIKAVTPELHRKWTGVDNALILDNLRRLSALGAQIIPRVPLIPGVNDTDEEFGRIVDLVDSMGMKLLHVLPFHQYGSNKYDLAQIPYEMAEFPEENEERILACIAMAEGRGLTVSRGGG